MISKTVDTLRRIKRIIKPIERPFETEAKAVERAGGLVTYLEIGAADGADWRWLELIKAGFVRSVLIDPADSWRSGENERDSHSQRVQVALGAENGQHPLYITRHPACTSCLRPNMTTLAKYQVAPWFDVTAEETVELRRYDEVAAEHDLPKPEIVKLDVQGFEAKVLEGMGAALDDVLCLEMECQLQSLYEGQANFTDLYATLISRGFQLRDLQPQGPFDGEALEFNGFWAKRPSNEREQRIIELWSAINQLWTAPSFNELDEHERGKFRFNDA